VKALLAVALAVAGGTGALGRWQASAVQGDQAFIRAPREVRVVLGSSPSALQVGGPTPWRLVDAWGRVHARGRGAGEWRIEREGRRLRAASVRDARATAWSDEPFTLQPDTSAAIVSWGTTRYRGELRYLATDTALVVANVLPIEEYLRGVVPLEIGARSRSEQSAVEAQAIAARSYTVVRALEGVTRAWDLTSRATDQVYGGVGAETAIADAAVIATTAVVIAYRDQVVRAPYHSTCGGATAAPTEVFRGGVDGFLRAVSDRIPGSDRSWCDISPRFTWERAWSPAMVAGMVGRTVPGQGVRRVDRVESTNRTSSGRVASLRFQTDRGTVLLTGNEMRFALAGVGGDILPSTYFSFEWSPATGIRLRGRGNGHGVGMCQWGAIGRARAGMDAASILLAYFPGTTLARIR
jgi:stage II sporulation protein D